jgi:hypothetical protein
LGGREGPCMVLRPSPPTPRASAGKTSVTRFRKRIWRGKSGNGASAIEAGATSRFHSRCRK